MRDCSKYFDSDEYERLDSLRKCFYTYYRQAESPANVPSFEMDWYGYLFGGDFSRGKRIALAELSPTSVSLRDCTLNEERFLNLFGDGENEEPRPQSQVEPQVQPRRLGDFREDSLGSLSSLFDLRR